MTAGVMPLFGLEVDALTMAEAVAECERAVEHRTSTLVGVVNAAKIVRIRSDEQLRNSLLSCDLVLADGQSVVWASNLLSRPLPERIAGIDLFEELLRNADRHGRTIYLLGARADVLDRLHQRIEERFPGARIVGARDGYFGEDEADAIAADIRRTAPDMLFLGMSSPKKEIFLARYGAELGVPVMHGVGGSFDVLAGITKRAPARWQRYGFEWLYRLLQEPGRMWRRYLVTNTAFVWLVVRERVRETPLFWPTELGSQLRGHRDRQRTRRRAAAA
jgi:N-acetylglucosaminyldiphosphoundecaprenol N-acetyl-beta-D-mannosaminyltransferase